MRIDGWEERLAEVVEAAQSRPFVWGSHDCCMFAAVCVDAITGSDLADRLGYTDETGAHAIIAQHGGLAEAVAHHLGESVDRWALARRGDVCLVPTEQGDGVGVCIGAQIAVAAERGLEHYPLHLAQRVWRIE